MPDICVNTFLCLSHIFACRGDIHRNDSCVAHGKDDDTSVQFYKDQKMKCSGCLKKISSYKWIRTHVQSLLHLGGEVFFWRPHGTVMVVPPHLHLT